MNIYLFGQSLLTILSMVCATLTCGIVMQMRRKQSVPYLIGSSILGGFAIQITFALLLGDSAGELPSLLWLMVTPWLFSIALIFGVFRLRRYTRIHGKMSKQKARKGRFIYMPIALNVVSCLL